ncbi:hypothetical protein FQN50_005382 [Emmonsiellopsis sp. PD_5]|nr:hypothetical protein FQN50_005382 [Emmonsiellopsis sp. PD_5]
MSELQKSFAKSRLAKLPPEVPVFDERDEEEEEDHANLAMLHEHHDDDSSSASSASSTGTVRPSPSQNLFARTPRELFIEHDVGDLHITHHAYISSPSVSGPLFVTHHGAGSSGLSFAACAAEIKKIIPTAGILSLDARNHGQTTSTVKSQERDQPKSQNELDLNLETLSGDLVFIIEQTRLKMNWDSLPDLVLVGHSLGGAVVTDAAKRGQLGSKLLAYAVLDVVEDLAATKPFWENWFIGLSKKFLEARGGKLLLLAGTDRLDTELTIGQMQAYKTAKHLPSTKTGKYQLQVFPEAGHFIQEDQPAKTAQILVDFYKRNDRSALVLPPKVGDILAAKAMAKGPGTGPGVFPPGGGWKKPEGF